MSIGYYSYLALSQSNGIIRKKGYEFDCENVAQASYFSQSFPESVVDVIRKDFDSSFYLCRTPFHLVGSGIPFNSGAIQYSATEREIVAIKTSVIEGMPDIDPGSLFVWQSGAMVRILNLSEREFNFTWYYPSFLNGLHTYTYIAVFKKIQMPISSFQKQAQISVDLMETFPLI